MTWNISLFKIFAIKIFDLQKEAIRTINNLTYDEHNTYFKCNKILKLAHQYNLQLFNYIFQLLLFSIDEEISPNLLVNHQIHNHNTKSNNQKRILRVNRSQTKHCVLHNYTMV